MKDYLKCAMDLKNNYEKVKSALPWLDVAVYENEKTAFSRYAQPINTDYARTAEVLPDSNIRKLKADGVQILRYNTERCHLKKLHELFPVIIQQGMPISVLHTQLDFEKIEEIAAASPQLKIIIESGTRKLIYHIEKILKVLKKFHNIYLCSYNFCNWLGHEKLISEGLAERLLYGSHMPVFSDDVSMSPIIMGNFPWKIKCDFAGNNLRRLLNLPLLSKAEIKMRMPEPFIFDAHAHNQRQGEKMFNGFPTPDMNYTPSDWIKFMDSVSLDRLILIPLEALFEEKSALIFAEELIKFAPERFGYMEVFNPAILNSKYLESFKNSLNNSRCVGIKIHPSSHKIEADDQSYEQVFKFAEEYGKPILTHSWDVSEYNPAQYMSHPDRFRKHLEKYHKTPFILGHAGGRPGALDATVNLCMDFANVYVDFAGDYYHNGVIDAFAEKLGTDRMLYASDVNWFDPRCNIGLFLGSHLKEAELLKTFRTNAIRVYFYREM
jgi:predicted TIM-barrel fold metal-dependent hydrolase